MLCYVNSVGLCSLDNVGLCSLLVSAISSYFLGRNVIRTTGVCLEMGQLQFYISGG